MARKSSSTAVQEELYPLPVSRDDERERGHRDDEASRPAPRAREPFDDSRVIDLETEQESPFLRGQNRVSVRRGSLPKKTANGLKWAALAVAVLTLLGIFGAALYSYGKHSWRFRIDSSDQIEVAGAQHVTRAQVMEVMGGDIGRNVFFVPLDQRQQQLQQIPWVESASVMRFVPNRLRIEIHERTPVAFARVGSHISLIDAGGNLMELASGPKHKYSFPVIAGMNASEPLSTRAARMKNYNELVRQLDSGGAHYSQDISEVDLTDSEDVKITTADSSDGVLVHLGNGNYLQRYKIYVTNVEAWRQQFQKLESVDLRYDGQIIVNPDLQGIPRQPALTPAATKAALAAGVKNAAIVNYEKYVNRPAPTPVTTPAPAKSKAGQKAAGKTTPKFTAKPASNVAPRAASHHAAPKAKAKTNSEKPPVSSVIEKNLPPVSTPKSSGAKQLQASVPKPAAIASSQKKPSPAIAKEVPQN
ncbi:MAG: FtsQ-type POTRA domain-containing protein [Terriglobales bacterium]